MTWEIALGIFALATFCIAIVTPIIKLNTTIAKLNASVEYLNKLFDRHEERITHLEESKK